MAILFHIPPTSSCTFILLLNTTKRKTMQNSVFCDITLQKVNRRFGEKLYVYVNDLGVSQVSSGNQANRRLLWHQKSRYCVHRSSQLFHILSQKSAVHIAASMLMLYFHLLLFLRNGLFPSGFETSSVYIYLSLMVTMCLVQLCSLLFST